MGPDFAVYFTVAYTVVTQIFILGLTFGWVKTSINNIDRRLERVENKIDKANGHVVN